MGVTDYTIYKRFHLFIPQKSITKKGLKMTNNLTNGKSIGSPMVNNTDFDESSKSPHQFYPGKIM